MRCLVGERIVEVPAERSEGNEIGTEVEGRNGERPEWGATRNQRTKENELLDRKSNLAITETGDCG